MLGNKHIIENEDILKMQSRNIGILLQHEASPCFMSASPLSPANLNKGAEFNPQTMSQSGSLSRIELENNWTTNSKRINGYVFHESYVYIYI